MSAIRPPGSVQGGAKRRDLQQMAGEIEKLYGAPLGRTQMPYPQTVDIAACSWSAELFPATLSQQMICGLHGLTSELAMRSIVVGVRPGAAGNTDVYVMPYELTRFGSVIRCSAMLPSRLRCARVADRLGTVVFAGFPQKMAALRPTKRYGVMIHIVYDTSMYVLRSAAAPLLTLAPTAFARGSGTETQFPEMFDIDESCADLSAPFWAMVTDIDNATGLAAHRELY